MMLRRRSWVWGRGGATSVERAPHVDAEELVPLPRAPLRERLHHGLAGVVDDDVEATERRPRLLDGTLDLRIDRHIGGRDTRATTDLLHEVRRLFEVRLGARGEPDVRARRGERHGHGAAEPAAGAGDQGHPARQHAGVGHR